MKMKDLIDLVRAGLKPSEIKEMIELEKQAADINIDEPEPEPKPQPNVKPEPDKKTDPDKKTEPDKNTEPDAKDVSGVDDTTADELKKAQDEILKLKDQIKEIQKENKSKDISNNQNKTLDEQIVDIFNQML